MGSPGKENDLERRQLLFLPPAPAPAPALARRAPRPRKRCTLPPALPPFVFCYSLRVSTVASEGTEFPLPEIDANGVDRSQIRAALRLTPAERLRRAEQFAEDTLRVWEQNGIRPLR